MSSTSFFDALCTDNAVAKEFLENLETPLIECFNHINHTDDTLLHAIVAFTKKTEIFDYLLQNPDIDINCTNAIGETPLLKAIRYSKETFARKLIEAGADLSTSCLIRVTPLHEAVKKCLEIAHLLIEKGADINALDWDNNTPLHRAVSASNFDTVAMLLYYGADANAIDSYGFTPFMMAIEKNVDLGIQELLLDYEADFNRKTFYGACTLSRALCKKSPLVLDIIQRGANVNYSDYTGNAFIIALQWKDSSLFKTIWPMFDCDIVYGDNCNFLLQRFAQSDMPVTHWFECLSILFSSDAMFKVIDHWKCNEHTSFFYYVFTECFKRNISETEVFPLICICLSLGAEVFLNDVEILYNHYGYNETLKLFLQVGVNITETKKITLPLFICDINKDPRSVLRQFEESEEFRQLANLLPFFTPPPNCIEKYHRLLALSMDDKLTESYKSFNKCCVPSLLELSRDTTRKAVCSQFNVTHCLRFYAILNYLQIPKIIKQMIAYEIPIYKSI